MNRRQPAAGLYLHVPFCSAICPYCDFAVQVGNATVRAGFVDSLLTEIALWSDWSHPIDTLYLGGGTPSLLSPAALDSVLNAARTHLPLLPSTRIALEANPEDIAPDVVRAWKTLGVATVSLGVQSFDRDELRFLGRRHDPAAAANAVETCLGGGFDTVSVDLMFGLPGQTPATWTRSLDRAAASGAQHISCYQLTIHEGTNFGRRAASGRLSEMPEAPQAELYEATHERLMSAGFHGYEVSNFARTPEHRSQHNLKYWRHVPYLGLGPAAHSFDGSRRWWNHRGLTAYQGSLQRGQRPIEGDEDLSPEQLATEALMLGLRLADGIDLDGFRRRFGFDLVDRNAALVQTCLASGHLRHEGARLTPTVSGMAVADGLAARFHTAPPPTAQRARAALGRRWKPDAESDKTI